MHNSAIRCVRSHDQSIGKNGKFDPHTKWLKIFKFLNAPRLYDYVAELGCCGEIGEVFLTHTVIQSTKFFHVVYRSQIFKDLKHLWLKTCGFTHRCAY